MAYVNALAALALVFVPHVASNASPPDARVVFETKEGKETERPLEELSLRDPRKEGAHFVRFLGLPRGEAPKGARARLELSSGDELFAAARGGQSESLQLELIGDVSLNLSIDHLAALRFDDRIPAGWVESIGPAPEGDRIYRRKQSLLDRIDGSVVEFSTEGIVFESVLGEKTFAWTEVAALFLEVFDEGGDERTEGVPAVVDLVDQGRLRGELVGIDRAYCTLKTLGAQLELPLWAVSEVFVDDGSLAFLSDLEPSEVDEGSPFGDDLGMSWPYVRDRSVTGAPLTVGGRVHSRGLGVHAPSRLVWKLDGSWNELLGQCALDDQVLRLPERGSVQFRVSVDGKNVWESPVVRGGDRALTLPPIDLKGATTLALEVDMATDFYVADRADWLRMLLVK